MKIVIRCPKCNSICTIVLEKTLPINKDILARCPNCKWTIPVSLYKTKQSKVW